MSMSFTLARLSPLFAALLFLTGCNPLHLLKDPGGDVKFQVKRMGNAISNEKWDVLKALLHRDMIYETHTGKRTAKGKGAGWFKRSLDALPDGRMSFETKLHSVDVVTEGRILAVVEMRLRIRWGASDMKHVSWKTSQTWVKVPQTGGRPWRMIEYVELDEKRDNYGKLYGKMGKLTAGATKTRTGTTSRAAKSSQRPTASGGISATGTGQSQFKVKSKVQGRVNGLSANRDKALE